MWAVLTVLSLTVSVDALEEPVRVTGGSIESGRENGLTLYRGIPFAAPPASVGE